MSLSKEYLNDPGRIAIIKKQRKMLHYSMQSYGDSPTSSPGNESMSSSSDEDSCVNKYDYDEAKVREKVNELKGKEETEIFWNEMKGKGSRTYIDRFIELTIIEKHYAEMCVDNIEDVEEDPVVGRNFLVEDKNGAVIILQVCFYPLPDCFAVGAKLILVDPICRFDSFVRLKPTSWLHLDETNANTFITVGRKNDMCRYCGEENAKMKCANCNHVYCGRECQVKDWKVLKHELVCKTEDDESMGTEKSGGGTSKKDVSIPTPTKTRVPVQDKNDTQTDEEELTEEAKVAKVTEMVKE